MKMLMNNNFTRENLGKWNEPKPKVTVKRRLLLNKHLIRNHDADFDASGSSTHKTEPRNTGRIIP